MTYFGLLLSFLALPILLFLVIAWLDERRTSPTRGFGNSRAVWIGIAGHVFLAVIYTTPWDNYLVATGVWYYNPNLVTGLVLGYVPIEEYTFFILETILVGLWWWSLAHRIPPRSGFRPSKTGRVTASVMLFVLWVFFAVLFFNDIPPFTYLSITLFWALPPILLQLLFGADILWNHRRLVALAILVPVIYLSLTDMLALVATIWSISPAQTTGILFLGILPLEEVIFFLMTNILIVFGMTLLLASESRGRLEKIKKMFEHLSARTSDA
jgi:lycopene cyclase domain-containing protein